MSLEYSIYKPIIYTLLLLFVNKALNRLFIMQSNEELCKCLLEEEKAQKRYIKILKNRNFFIFKVTIFSCFIYIINLIVFCFVIIFICLLYVKILFFLFSK